MPTYINPDFKKVPESEALLDDGANLRPGYRAIVGHGETVHFNIKFRDSAKDSVYLTDASGKIQSVEEAWRSYAAREFPQGASHPQDITSHFRRFAERYSTTVGASALAKLAGVDLEQKESSNMTPVTDAVPFGRPGPIFDSMPTGAMDNIDSTRRAWLRDKATAYARKPQHNATGPIAQPTADAAPKPQTESAARAAIADARAARCARLANAYKS